MIFPKETAWYWWYGYNTKVIVPLEKQDIYLRDLIGLKYLNENGKLKFVEF